MRHEDGSKRRRARTLYESLVDASRVHWSWMHRRALVGARTRKARLLPYVIERTLHKACRLAEEEHVGRIADFMVRKLRMRSLRRALAMELQLCQEDAVHVPANAEFVPRIQEAVARAGDVHAEMTMLVLLARLKVDEENRAKIVAKLRDLRSMLPPHRARLIDEGLAGLE